jgi:hypothetical protein
MVRNGYGVKYIWYETAILWYEMVMVQNAYGTKWFLVIYTMTNSYHIEIEYHNDQLRFGRK